MEVMMNYVQPFFHWLLQTTLIGSVVICVILAAQKTLGGKLGPRWCHALWLVLLIRMVLPWSPSSRISLLNLIPSWDRQTQWQQPPETTEQRKTSQLAQTSGTTKAIPVDKPQPDAAIQKQTTPKPGTLADMKIKSKAQLISLRRVLPILWLAGAMVIGAYLLMSNFALWRIVKRQGPLVNQEMLELFEKCKEQMGIHTLVAVVPSCQIRSPALFGFVRPRLLLPQEMLEKASYEEMRYVFLHELAHLKRRDIYVGWITSFLQVLHWFNPLVWFAFYRMRIDRELACDALVLARTQKEESQEYGQAIVGLLRRFSRSRPLPAMAGILENRSQLKRRITMIARFKKNSYQWSPLAVCLIILLACISLPDAKRTKASETSAAKLPPMVVRQVWADAADPYFMGAPSPDGKYLSYVDWETGDLAVRELATGKNRRLTSEGWSKGRAGHSIFSPDSKYVACRWRGRGARGLRIIGLDGSERLFIKHPEGITILRPTNWSVDGKHILAFGGAMWDDSDDAFKFLKILFISVEDGDVRVLKTIEQPAHHKRSGQLRMSLSPDRRYVAYSFPPADNSGKGDIWVFGTDGGQEIQLVEHPADDFVLAWSPDGNRIIFASDRTGTMGIWAVEVADGKPQSAPQLLKAEVGRFHPLGLIQDGSYYYGTFSGGSNIYVAAFDPQKRNVTGQPALAIQHYEGSNWAPDWSPDGRYLACVSSDPGTAPRLVIQSMETGEVREITPELKEFNVHSLRWSTDGRSLLGAGSTTNGPWGALQIDVKTGEVTTFGQGPAFGPESTPDGKAIFYIQNIAEKGGRIMRRELKSQEEKELYNSPDFISALTLSPDGQQLAFSKSGGLIVLSVEGGEAQELLKTNGKITIAWTPNGDHLIYGIRGEGDEPGQLWRIPAEGGEPRKLDLAMRGLGHLRFHPDGQRITFRASPRGEKSEVWVIENFLPVAPVAKPEPELAVHRVWADALSVCGTPSPDGRYLPFVDWDTGDLAVHDLTTGKNQRLTNKGTRNESNEFAGPSVFSPDGKQVAYIWRNKDNFYELRTVGLDGSEPRVLYRNRDAKPTKPYAWSTDGEHVLALLSKRGKTNQIALVSVPSGSAHTIKSLGWRPANMDLSPDGRFIVYDDWTEIRVLATDGSGETTLVDHPAAERLLGWSPGGEWILFTSDRRGTWDAWAVQIRDGKPQGPAELVRLNIGQVSPVGFTRNGAFYYTTWSGHMSSVYTATFDMEAGKVLTKPVNLTQHRAGENTFAGWSPDGKWLAYFSRPYVKIPPRSTIVIRDMETGEEREIDPKKIWLDPLPGGCWSADGRSLLLVGRDLQMRQSIYRLVVGSGEATRLVRARSRPMWPAWSPDGKAIYYIQPPVIQRSTERAQEPSRIVAREVESGQERELARMPIASVPGTGLALSPDGRRLAFFAPDEAKQSMVLKIVPVGEGETRELSRVQEPESVRGAPAWSPDGKQLLYIVRSADQETHTLWRVSTEDGKAQKLDLAMRYLNNVQMHPDGKQIAFSAHSAQSAKSEVWVMENLLPIVGK